MINPTIISALTDIEDMCENRKSNMQICDEAFRDIVYDKAKQIVDCVEFENMSKDHDKEE